MTALWTMDVCFPFDADAVPRGARNVRPMAFWGRTSVSLRVLDADAFRPAMIIRDHSPRSGWWQPVPETVLMGFDGGLWAPLPDPDGGQDWIPTLAGRASSTDPRARGDNPFDLRGDTVRVAEDGFRARPAGAPAPELSIDEVPLRGVERSSYEQSAADAQRVADSLVVIDRKVWRRCHDPFWHAYHRRAFLIFGRDDVAREPLRPELDRTVTFRVDRADDVRRWTRALARWDRSAVTADERIGSAEIMEPSLLSRDDMRHYAGRLDVFAEQALPLLKDAEAEALHHAAALRDEGRRLRECWSRPLALDALVHLEHLRRRLDRDGDLRKDYAMRTKLRNQAWTIVQRAAWFDGFDMHMPAFEPEDEAALSALGPSPI